MRAPAPLSASLLLFAASVAGAADATLPTGRCNGGSSVLAAPQGGKLLDLRAHPIPEADRPAFEALGYHAVADGGSLLDSKGAPITEDAMSFLEAPWDASSEKVTMEVWNALMLDGYRLDEGSCRLNGADSKPIRRITVQYYRLMSVKSLTQTSLERLLAAIRTLPPGAPLPANVRVMVEQMRAAGVTFPFSVTAALERPGATVGALRGPATVSYEGLQRFFDGQVTLSDSLGLAVPARGGAAGRRAAYRDSKEREFGLALQEAFTSELSRNPVGRDLLARFKRDRRNGVPNLMVLKFTQRPEETTAGAIYSPDKDTLVINHWIVANVVLMRTPAEKRAQVSPLLSDPVKLMAFVSKDPALMKAVIQEVDVEYFHELLHADQSRRTRINDEGVRGNTPQANPLDDEREAHREHCRYLFSKASYDPDAVHSSRWRDYCVGMLRDPDAFQDAVTHQYLETFAGSATGPEFLQMQEVRRAAADAPADGWVQKAKQALRRIGLHYGDQAIADFSRDVRARSAEFDGRIPAFRARSADLMSWAMRSHPASALSYLTIDPKWMESPQAEILVGEAKSWLMMNGADAAQLNDRLSTEDILSDWSGKKGRALSAELVKIVAKDRRAAAQSWLALALAAPAGPKRDYSFANAQSYAIAANDKALIKKIRALKEAQ